MKKYLSILLALCMLLSVAVGCTQQPDDEPEVKEEAPRRCAHRPHRNGHGQAHGRKRQGREREHI